MNPKWLTPPITFAANLLLRTQIDYPPRSPQKGVILYPGSLAQILLATALLSQLKARFPDAQLDWVVGDWSRKGLVSHPAVHQLVPAGGLQEAEVTPAAVDAVVERLREKEYDSCWIPSHDPVLSYCAWQAEIPQRVGYRGGWGLTHSCQVEAGWHVGEAAVALLRPYSTEPERPFTEYYPTDDQRQEVAEKLDTLSHWSGERPLVILHPGGGESPQGADARKRWPVSRFALLGNYAVRELAAQVVLVGGEIDRPLAAAIEGLMSYPVTNLVGELSLGELGALCEVGSAYVGNDTGPTHIAAAVGCPTVAIYGPTRAERIKPLVRKANKLIILEVEQKEPFSWENGVPVEEAVAAVRRLVSMSN